MKPRIKSIKQRFIQWFEPNLNSRVLEFLECTTVPRKKPLQFLLTLRTKLAQSDMSEAIIRKLFIAKMSETFKKLFNSIEKCFFRRMVVTTDQMITSSGKINIEQSLFTIKQDRKTSFTSTEQCDELSWRISSLESRKLTRIRL